MTHHHLQAIAKKYTRITPTLRPGYAVRIHQKIKEGEKERIQIFEGLVIALNSGNGSNKTFTVRKVVQGIGVEKIFPLYSPNIAKIEIKKTFGVRRAKLYYLRKEEGLSSRLRAKLGLIQKDEKMNNATNEKLTDEQDHDKIVNKKTDEKAETSVVPESETVENKENSKDTSS